MNITPVILAGGSGSRLWPLSRTLRPKQFLKLLNDLSMLQSTLLRLKNISNVSKPIIVCNEDHRFLVSEQLLEIGILDAQIILEPSARDTAPAIAVASLYTQDKIDSDSLILVLAADHDIKNTQAFELAVEQASKAAISGSLLTFGIVPESAHTGYGYIKTTNKDSDIILDVSQFVEKPDEETAQKYLDSGEYYWNSGMFMFQASVIISELKKHQPELLQACQKALFNSDVDLDFVRLQPNAFSAAPSISIDYAIMEKSSQVKLVPLSAGWSDVGCWKSLWEISDKDCNNNVCVGDVIAQDTSNSYIRSSQKLVTTLGVDNLVIIETQDALLIADKSKVQKVKNIVSTLKDKDRYEIKHHRHVYRPWGYYDSIDSGSRFQVKRIVVKPGAKLSVQMHHHRAEHWIIVKGIANVTCGENIKLLRENESIYIPLGEVHALENPGKINLELIEVQSGSYLGEDDIVRFEDRYGRSANKKQPAAKIKEPIADKKEPSDNRNRRASDRNRRASDRNRRASDRNRRASDKQTAITTDLASPEVGHG